MKKIILLILSICTMYAQDYYGCTDPTACNYDNEATIDDGSCVMPDVCGDCSGETYTFYLNPGGTIYSGEEVSHVEMTVGETFEFVASTSVSSGSLAKKVSSITYYMVDGLTYSFTRPDNFNYDEGHDTSPVYPEWFER